MGYKWLCSLSTPLCSGSYLPGLRANMDSAALSHKDTCMSVTREALAGTPHLSPGSAFRLSYLLFARAILHLNCPHLTRNPVDLNPNSDHMDLTSWFDVGFTSSLCIYLLTSAFGWRLSTDLSWLPSSSAVDLAVLAVMVLCLPCCLDLPPLWTTLSLLNDKDTSAIMLGKKFRSIKNK